MILHFECGEFFLGNLNVKLIFESVDKYKSTNNFGSEIESNLTVDLCLIGRQTVSDKIVLSY